MKKVSGKSIIFDLILQRFLLVSLIFALLSPYASALKDMNSNLYQYYFATLVEEREDSEKESESDVSILTFIIQTVHNFKFIPSSDNEAIRISSILPLTGFTEHELPPPEPIHI